MENGRSLMQFNGYEAITMKYEKAEPTKTTESIELCPSFFREIAKESEGKYTLDLGVRLDDDELPFRIELILKGYFTLEDVDDPEKSMRINGTAILFPYLRSTLSLVTMMASIPPITLPTFNIVELFEEKDSASQSN